MERKPLNLSLPADLIKKLKIKAVLEETTPSQYVEQLLRKAGFK